MSTVQSKRDESIDLMKAILVVLMIMRHIVDFFPAGRLTRMFGIYVDLTTFPGFMFAFGYVCYQAYFTRPANPALFKRLGKGFLKTMLAFYISGIGWNIIVAGRFTIKRNVRTLLLLFIPGYSEYLLSFAFIYLLIFVWVRFGKKIKGWQYMALAVLSLLLTQIPYSLIRSNVLGVFIGTENYCTFPIVQYITFFMAGAYLSAKKKTLDLRLLAVSIVGFVAFCGFRLMTGDFPERFPPAFFWIAGGYFFVYMYFLVCKYAAGWISKISLLHPIVRIGQNSLVFLVISNLIIFTLQKYFRAWFLERGRRDKLVFYAGAFALCIIVPSIYAMILRRIKGYREHIQMVGHQEYHANS